MSTRILSAFISIVLFGVASLCVQAQEAQCALKLSELPASAELLGFRLGMTTEEVKKRVPQVVFGRIDDFAVSKTTINPDFDTRIDKASFPGVRTVSLDFLDDKLTSLWFGYDPTFKWRTVDDYVKGISQALRLPVTWTNWRIRGQRLRCADFELTVSMLGEGPSFRILDLSAEETIAARRQAKEEEAAALEQQEEVAVLGNKKAKVFYLSACAPAEDEIKESDRVIFKNREEAEKAGYKLAQDCQ
jgi:hypothetical protein